MTDDGTAGPNASHVLTGDEVMVQSLINALPFYLLMIDSRHRIVMANQALYGAYGLRPQDAVGAYCPKLIHGIDGPYAGCPIEEALQTNHSVERELLNDADGSWKMSAAYLTDMVTADGQPILLHLVSDITEKKRAAEEVARLNAGLEETVALRTRELEAANSRLELEMAERVRAEAKVHQLAYYDALTKLPNRVSFGDILEKAVHSARRHDRKFAVCMLDLDGFKSVNDTSGHSAGDELLCTVGKRLEEVLRGSDVAARMGGDEFLFLFTDIADSEDIGSIGERLLKAFEAPFRVNGRDLRITASVGGAVYPDDGGDGDTLMKHADIAMYEAKNTGKNQFCWI